MNPVQIRALDGTERFLPSEAIDGLASSLRGELLHRASPAYDAARTVWNAMIDRRPGLIVRCHGASDVMRAVRFAREHSLLVSVRGAGHNIAGSAVSDGGVMIDLSPMKSVRVDPLRRTVRVEPGVTLGELDRETQAFGLATPVGINSTTGIAGLTLGGGFGWLSRLHGLTSDNLCAADVVTADGELVHASADENPDLFWGLRGGGGNFGIVTSFELESHEVGPEVLSGLIVHPIAAGPEVLRHYREFTRQMPDELNVWVVLRHAPPLPFLPQEVHGQLIVVLACFHAGEMAKGEKLLAPLRAFGTPIADVVGPHSYVAWQSAFDPLLEPGARNYWKSHNFTELPDGLLDTLLASTHQLPTPHSEIFVARLGGAINRVPADATAYPHRDVEYVMNVHTRWEEPGDDARSIEWARRFFAETEPFATGGVYVNFMPEDEGDRIGGAYAQNYERLAKLKGTYDPDNFFRVNQNVRPAR